MEKRKHKSNDCIGAYRRTGRQSDPDGSYTGNCDTEQNRNDGRIANDTITTDDGYNGSRRQNPYGNVFLPPFTGTTEAQISAGQMSDRFPGYENVDYGVFTGNTDSGISDGENDFYRDSVFADRVPEKPIQDADDL